MKGQSRAGAKISIDRTNKLAVLAVTVLALMTGILATCGNGPVEEQVTGTVAYSQSGAAESGTVLIVQIQDVTAADAPATVVGEQIIEDPGPVPVAFAVGYDPAAIDEGHDYIVHARVEDGSGQVLYTTTQQRAVITQGHPTENITINLEAVGGETAPSGGQAGGETPSSEAQVTGTVAYSQSGAAESGVVLIVQIQDVTAADAPATVVGEQVIEDPGPVPVAFAVGYDPAAIDEGHDYIVHARVEDGTGQVLHTTMQQRAVITQGHPTENIAINLEALGGN